MKTVPKTLSKRKLKVTPSRRPAAKPVAPSWQLQTAKAQFSEVFRRARTEGPQLITRHGKEAVVMVSDAHYEQLVGRSRQSGSIVQFFRDSPLVGVELDLTREKDEGRDIEI